MDADRNGPMDAERSGAQKKGPTPERRPGQST
jgi:hypothetical protein